MRYIKIATFNVNNINKRLPNLLEWLEESRPDIACLQETKTPDSAFPRAAIEKAGYGAIHCGRNGWNGVAILARDAEPMESRRELPGDSADGGRASLSGKTSGQAADKQPRYIEAAVNGVLIGCLYAPNGNPQPGPKFDYKLAWMARLHAHAATLCASGLPVVLAGDYNVVPTDFDIYPKHSLQDNALLQPEPRAAYRRLLAQGWIDALRALHPDEPMYTFWGYLRNRWARDAGLRIDHLLLSAAVAPRLVDAGVDKAVRGRVGASDHAPAWIVLRAD